MVKIEILLPADMLVFSRLVDDQQSVVRSSEVLAQDFIGAVPTHEQVEPDVLVGKVAILERHEHRGLHLGDLGAFERQIVVDHDLLAVVRDGLELPPRQIDAVAEPLCPGLLPRGAFVQLIGEQIELRRPVVADALPGHCLTKAIGARNHCRRWKDRGDQIQAGEPDIAHHHVFDARTTGHTSFEEGGGQLAEPLLQTVLVKGIPIGRELVGELDDGEGLHPTAGDGRVVHRIAECRIGLLDLFGQEIVEEEVVELELDTDVEVLETGKVRRHAARHLDPEKGPGTRRIAHPVAFEDLSHEVDLAAQLTEHPGVQRIEDVVHAFDKFESLRQNIDGGVGEGRGRQIAVELTLLAQDALNEFPLLLEVVRKDVAPIVTHERLVGIVEAVDHARNLRIHGAQTLVGVLEDELLDLHGIAQPRQIIGHLLRRTRPAIELLDPVVHHLDLVAEEVLARGHHLRKALLAELCDEIAVGDDGQRRFGSLRAPEFDIQRHVVAEVSLDQLGGSNIVAGVFCLHEVFGEAHQIGVEGAPGALGLAAGPFDEFGDLDKTFHVFELEVAKDISVEVAGHLEDQRRTRRGKLDITGLRDLDSVQATLQRNLAQGLPAAHLLAQAPGLEIDLLDVLHLAVENHLGGLDAPGFKGIDLGSGHPEDRCHHIDIDAGQTAGGSANTLVPDGEKTWTDVRVGGDQIHIEVTGHGGPARAVGPAAEIGEKRRVLPAVTRELLREALHGALLDLVVEPVPPS